MSQHVRAPLGEAIRPVKVMESCSNVEASKEVACYPCNLWKGPALVDSTVDFLALICDLHVCCRIHLFGALESVVFGVVSQSQ